MKCTGCSGGHALVFETISDGLRLRRCPGCGGRWIRSDSYWRWRALRRHGPSSDDDAAPTQRGAEEPTLRVCPEDGYILARFAVGPRHGFSIDQCRHCSGVWLDAGEWEALRSGGLADRLHIILSEAWQDRLRAEQRAGAELEHWERQLGAADLARIREIKNWLDDHPRRSELYAFLRFHGSESHAKRGHRC